MNDDIVFFNGAFLPKHRVSISPDDRGFLFGDGVYEVIRTYSGRMFLAAEHFERLFRSLSETRIAVPSVDFDAVSRELSARNEDGDRNGVVYIQVTRGAAPRSHRFPDESIPPTVYAFYQADSVPPARTLTACTVPDNRWGRCDIKSISLIANVLANQAVVDRGADEALLVRDGCVTEGSHSSFFAVFDGTVVTHPANHHILPGITRQLIGDLCRAQRIPLDERAIEVNSLTRADEAFLVGTRTEIAAVITIDGQTVGSGETGPVTRRLQEAFDVYRRSATGA